MVSTTRLPSAGADLAVAVGGGAELAKSSADIVLAGDHLAGWTEARQIALTTLRIMRQNLLWSLVYNAASLPLAAIGWIPLACRDRHVAELARRGRELAAHPAASQPLGQSRNRHLTSSSLTPVPA